MKRRRLTKRLWQQKIGAQRDRLDPLMYFGVSTVTIAKALRCSTGTVRDLAKTPEFQIAYETFRRDQWTAMARPSDACGRSHRGAGAA